MVWHVVPLINLLEIIAVEYVFFLQFYTAWLHFFADDAQNIENKLSFCSGIKKVTEWAKDK